MKSIFFSLLTASLLIISCAKDDSTKEQLQSISLHPASVGTINLKHLSINDLGGSNNLYDIFEVSCSPTSYNPMDATFTSSDPEIIKINEMGRFQILGEGNTTVTAMLGDKTATCDFHVISDTISSPVIPNDPNNAVMIYFNKAVINVLVDQAVAMPTVTLIPSTVDKSRVSFITADNSIAKVEPGGQIVGVAEGTTTITASIKAWPNKRGGLITAYATVNVKKY